MQLSKLDQWKQFLLDRPNTLDYLTKYDTLILSHYLVDPFANDHGFKRLCSIVDVYEKSLGSVLHESAVALQAKDSFKDRDLDFYTLTKRDPTWKVGKNAENLLDCTNEIPMTRFMLRLVGFS